MTAPTTVTPPTSQRLALVVAAVITPLLVVLSGVGIWFAHGVSAGYKESKASVQATLEDLHESIAAMPDAYAEIHPEARGRYALSTQDGASVITYGDPEIGDEFSVTLEDTIDDGRTVHLTAEVYTNGGGYHIQGKVDQGLFDKANGRIDDTGTFYTEVTR